MNVDQRTAVVTGANRGIGLEICRQLAQRGIRVILTSRDEQKGRAAQRELQSQGLELGFHQLDVTDPESIDGLVKDIRKAYRRIDILVNNAGVLLEGRKSALRTDLDLVRMSMETNVYGPLLLCQKIIPLMKRHNYGRIVNVSSGMGQLNDMGGGYVAYRLSKAALNVLTRVFSSEVQGRNILINSMCPGWVRTDMGGPGAARSVEDGADTAVWLALLPDDGPTGGLFRDREPVPW
jgi:NAD(P)-dependent dehydrogenase (short-subunit alcohol dehydrogenase family)